MGRAIRRVPPNWEHPRHTEETAQYRSWVGEYKSLYDETYETAADEWLEGFRKWEAGEDPDREKYSERYYWDWSQPPGKESYRPAFDAEPTWFQLYETVSEGSPVSPPFETEDELIDYLCTYGDSASQSREARSPGSDPIPTREQATALVKSGYAPSMAIIDGKILNPAEIAAYHAKPTP